MRSSVEQVLAQRARRSRRRPRAEIASLAAAVVLHGAAVATALVLPRLQPPPPPLEFVPVTIVPSQALGVRNPAPARPKPAPPAPEPEPEKPEPAPEQPAPEPEPEDEVPVLPREDEKKPEKKPEQPKPADAGRETPDTKPSAKTGGEDRGPAGAPGASGGMGTEAGRRGAPTGSPTGGSAFGVEGLDPDFTYGYYIDRLLSLIDSNWVRPSMGGDVRAVLFFRIERDGSMTGLRVLESSGYNSFDLAALRAVQNAAPFPPLPRAYRHDSLGVNLIVR
jgi:TonB family protein